MQGADSTMKRKNLSDARDAMNMEINKAKLIAMVSMKRGRPNLFTCPLCGKPVKIKSTRKQFRVCRCKCGWTGKK